MSMENVKKFMDLVRTDERLAKRMIALKDGLQEGEFAFKNDKEFVEKKILPLAKEYDLEFSVEDFVEFTKSQLVELSDEDLSSVSGGLITEFFLSLLAVGGINLAGNAVHAAVSSYFTGGGTSTVQSVTDKDVDMSSTAGAEEKGNKIEFDEYFKTIKKEFSQSIKAEFDGVKSYMSPQERSTWMDTVANQQKQISSRENKYVHAKYNKANDRIEFTASWSDKLNDHMDSKLYSQSALKSKLSNILKKQYNAAYGGQSAQLTQQYNELNTKLQQKQNEKAGYEATINGLNQSNTTLQQTADNCYTKLIAVCDVLIQSNPYNYQFVQWKQALQNKTFTNWDDLKENAAGYYDASASETNVQYSCANYVDTLLSTTQQIQTNNAQISTLQASAQQAQNEINSINSQIETVANRRGTYAARQQAFNDNMKTEFNYFYSELVKALKEDEELSKLAKAATTAEAKINLAAKIKEKADQLVQEQFSKQLLDGCSLVVEHQGDSIGMTIVCGGYWFHQNSFVIDEFISAEGHEAIANSESGKKLAETIEAIANYVNRKASASTNLMAEIKSVFKQIAKNELKDLTLGVKIIEGSSDYLKFSFSSGGRELTTTFDVHQVLDKCNNLKNMQALETTRQQNEGAISYTPFGRKLWNSIGSQAQHVLNTIAQIEAATGNLSDVKEREAFENDLKYVADQIAEESRGNVKKMYLAGEHRNDYSFKMEDLQKIKDFAGKIAK